MAESWSPRCQKCGGRGNLEVVPPPSMVFAGRLRPEATKPHKFGDRVRCSKCLTWFTLGPGTEWKPNPGGVKGYLPEPVPKEGGSDEGAEGHDEIGEESGEARDD